MKEGTIRLSGKKALHHKVRGAGLSEKAKRRSGVSGWYFMKSARHSANGKPNASLTCRHFGTRQSRFYRRQARYDKTRLASPRTNSRAPKRQRQPEYMRELAGKVRAIRKENPTYSGKKIRAHPAAEYGRGFLGVDTRQTHKPGEPVFPA